MPCWSGERGRSSRASLDGVPDRARIFALRSLRACAGVCADAGGSAADGLLSRAIEEPEDLCAPLRGRGILLPRALRLPVNDPVDGLDLRGGWARDGNSDGGCDGQSSVRSCSHGNRDSMVDRGDSVVMWSEYGVWANKLYDMDKVEPEVVYVANYNAPKHCCVRRVEFET